MDESVVRATIAAHKDHPLARYGYPEVEAEHPLDCPGCTGLYDARFWGNAAVSFMNRNETYRHDAGLMCPNCKRLYHVDRLMRCQAFMNTEEESGRLD